MEINKNHNYECIICNFITNHKNNFKKHELTRKHQRLVFGTMEIKKKPVFQYSCEDCKKKYKTASGLWKHSQKCTKIIVSKKINIEEISSHSNNNFVNIKVSKNIVSESSSIHNTNKYLIQFNY